MVGWILPDFVISAVIKSSRVVITIISNGTDAVTQDACGVIAGWPEGVICVAGLHKARWLVTCGLVLPGMT